MRHKRKFPRASPYTDRHGKRRWRFRKGGFSAELGTCHGGDDFVRRYEAAVEGHRVRGLIGADRIEAGSVTALVASYYRSPEYLGLSDSTKRAYRGVIEKFRAAHGNKPVRLMQRRHVQNNLADKAGTPSAANNLRKRLITLLDHAISLDWRRAAMAFWSASPSMRTCARCWPSCPMIARSLPPRAARGAQPEGWATLCGAGVTRPDCRCATRTGCAKPAPGAWPKPEPRRTGSEP